MNFSILSSIFRASHHFIYSVSHVCVVRFVFLREWVDSFISVISSLDTTGKRDSSSPSGVARGIFSSGIECCRCTLSDNSTCSVSVRGICESINDAVVVVGCVSCIPSVKFTSWTISPAETLSKVTNSAVLKKHHPWRVRFCCYSDCNQCGNLDDRTWMIGLCNWPITCVRFAANCLITFSDYNFAD